MTETIPVRVQHKRMTASAWASSSLVLLDGELGVETDTGKVKVGNGRDRFSALQYLTGPKGDRGETGPAGPRGADGVVRFEGSAAERALAEYAKKSETPVYRIAKGDISGSGNVATIRLTDLFNPENIKVGDIVEDYWSGTTGANQEFWKVTAVSSATATVQRLGVRNLPSTYDDSDIKRRIGALEARPVFSFDSLTEVQKNRLRGYQGPQGPTGPAGPAGPRGADGARGRDGAPGNTILDQNTGQALKYWRGSKAQYDAISNKDSNTIYDVYT